MKITIIGNNGNNSFISDGGRIKIRLYKTLLEKEKKDVNIIELDNWKKNIISIIKQIKKAVKRGDRIIVMAGPKGCRLIIPIVTFFNRKNKCPLIFCALGVGTIDKIIKRSTPERGQQFIEGQFTGFNKDKKMGKRLSSFEHVVLQNDTLKRCYEKYYGLKNVEILENFRDVIIPQKVFNNSPELKMVFLSRVKTNKGILDLISCIKELNNLTCDNKLKLDIYGENQLENDENQLFYKMLDSNITYKGVINSKESINILNNYDVFCLPTKYHGEGTPGALIEAMIAGAVPLISSYSQSKDLITHAYNGFVFEINNMSSLKKEILYLFNNLNIIKQVSINTQNSARKYTYSNNRESFLKLIAGDLI